MRLGVVWVRGSNANYRAFQPLRAMARRGHEIVWPPSEDGQADLRRLSACQVVHVYRCADELTRGVLAHLARGGIAVTYDNDDDLAALPRDSPYYARDYAGLKGQRHLAAGMKMVRAARVVTTTNDLLAQKYRRAGAGRVEVLGN